MIETCIYTRLFHRKQHSIVYGLHLLRKCPCIFLHVTMNWFVHGLLAAGNGSSAIDHPLLYRWWNP